MSTLPQIETNDAGHSRTSDLLSAFLLCCILIGSGCGGSAGKQAPPQPAPTPPLAPVTLAPDEVRAIMRHAARAIDREIAVAVTDRNGTILGVGATFAIAQATLQDPASCSSDGDCAVVNRAVQLARTASFFSADQTPLTSRSVRFISDVHFPPGVKDTVSAALFGIENTNRGCSFDSGGVGFIAGQDVPRALNLVSSLREGVGLGALRCEGTNDPTGRLGCSTGIATEPGGVPIFKQETGGDGNRRVAMAGGVGVALRGQLLVRDPIASRSGEPDILRKSGDDPNFDIAELAARAFAGDGTGFPNIARQGFETVCTSTTIEHPACCASAAACDFDILPARRLPFDPVIFIDGIEVPEVAGNPSVQARVGAGADLVAPLIVDPTAPSTLAARPVASGWLVGPNDATDAPAGATPLSKSEVEEIIMAGVTRALETRAAIRLPLEARTAMVLAVSDTNDKLLGLFRMTDATVFSIDVAVAKSRNVVYFSSLTIDPADTLDSPGLTDIRGQAFKPGTAITNRTLSFGGQPFFPSGIETSDPGPFRRAFLEDSATSCTNGREPANGRQNGIVFFPGSAPLYRDGVLIGGFGVSGDGVEQDDVVTIAGTQADGGFEPPANIRADQVKVRGVRLPYVKANRNPFE